MAALLDPPLLRRLEGLALQVRRAVSGQASNKNAALQAEPASAPNPSGLQPSMIATARVQPAEARSILTGKHDTVNPVDGSCSRLCSFSMWQ